MKRLSTNFILLLLLLMIFAVAGPGCDDDDDDDASSDCECTAPPPGVESEDDCFALSESVPAADGCNTCFCEDGGWSCTEMACGDDDDDDVSDDDDDDDDDDTTQIMSRLFATSGPDAAFFDSEGRQVLLRGVNFNHLGDYFESHPSLPNVSELSDEDWDDAAAEGLNVIRLVTTWSAWEPVKDQIDMAYLARVKDAIAEANARDMYVVIDMHQDAWSKFVFTPANETCPGGTGHQIGWDGAPEWATYTEGAETCTPGSREESPAVIKAWDNFYANRDGIMDELAELWGFIATEFTDHTGVAGYDLINEPGNGTNIFSTRKGISEFYRKSMQAIRDVEAAQKSEGHIIFFEPSVFGVPPEFDVNGPNTSFAGHNYFESIVHGFDGLLDFSFWLYDLLRIIYGAPVWVGEFGHFGGNPDREEWYARYGALEDQYLFDGNAWWQWEQECGDPHDVRGNWPPSDDWVAQQLLTCGDARMTPAKCTSRAYPRAVPGRLLSLEVQDCGGEMSLSGVTDIQSVADLWTPSDSNTEPTVTGAGIQGYDARKVGGGWRIDVIVDGDYQIEVVPADQLKRLN